MIKQSFQTRLPFSSALVTGASGLLGSNFLLTAARKYPGIKWLGVSKIHAMQIPGANHVRCDLADELSLLRLLDKVQPGIIFHFAAPTNVDWCEEHPHETHQQIKLVSARMAAWCQAGRSKLVYLSTDSVFDGRTGHYTEDDPPHPLNVYASCKLMAERAVANAVEDHLIVRGNIFGWNAQEKVSIAEWFLHKFATEGQAPGFTDSIFAPLLVNTLTSYLISMVALGLRGTWHAACAKPLSKYEFGLLLAHHEGLRSASVRPTLSIAARFKGPRPLNSSLNASRLEQRFGHAMSSIEDEITSFFDLRSSGFRDNLSKTIIKA